MKIIRYPLSVIFLLLILLFFQKVYAVNPITKADDILGTWINEEKKVGFEIYKRGSQYYAKIVWLATPTVHGKPKTDENNPDPAKRSQPLIGTVILKSLAYEDSEWKGGTIYNPKEGKTFDVYLKLTSQNKLEVIGYKGSRLFSKTQHWYRANLSKSQKD
ncbi:MAG: DUF2147 domain-containing protein [Thermonemataceae bacterium]